MKKFLLISLCVFSLCLSGCALFLVGAGVAGGVAISKDTAKLEIDSSYNKAWRAAHTTAVQMGKVTLQDKKAGKIEAMIQDSKVNITVIQVTPKSIRVEVKARKNLLPNIDLAVEVSNQISNKL